MELWLEIMWKERRSDAWWKDGKSWEKGKEKEKKKKCFFMFLRFYVEKAWNQKKLSIDD